MGFVAIQRHRTARFSAPLRAPEVQASISRLEGYGLKLAGTLEPLSE
jgi:hypothetical protein